MPLMWGDRRQQKRPDESDLPTTGSGWFLRWAFFKPIRAHQALSSLDAGQTLPAKSIIRLPSLIAKLFQLESLPTAGKRSGNAMPIDENWLQEALDYRLRELAANIIRVVRGAGRPDDIVDQCNEVLKAAIEYHDKTQRFVSDQSVAMALHLKPEQIRDYESFEGQRQLALRKMVKGSLQVAASRLLDQRTQENRGESEIFEAYRDLEHLYQVLRKQREAELRAARAKPAPRRKPAKRKTARVKRRDEEGWQRKEKGG